VSVLLNKKGIILAGGLGTRLSPLTSVISKQLLPLYDKPMVYYPLATLMEAKIRQVMVISTEKDIPRYMELLGDGSDFGMEIRYTIQYQPKGIAEAFSLTEEFIGSDGVCLILGDNIFYGEGVNKFLIERVGKTGGSVFAIEVEDPRNYGVIEKDKNGKVLKIIEKPKNPPTNLAVTGLYCYDNNVVEISKSIRPSKRGELEITDLNNAYLSKSSLEICCLNTNSFWFDTGSFESLFQASSAIKQMQEKTGKLIGSIELAAYLNGWICLDKLEQICVKFKNSGYHDKIKQSLTLLQ
jgi:glucose-1-phosphate thymidylyltransferase